MRGLFWAAALAGGYYWASKQPGGVSAVANKFGTKLKEVQNSEKPFDLLKSQFESVKSQIAPTSKIEPATPYTALPEHTTAG